MGEHDGTCGDIKGTPCKLVCDHCKANEDGNQNSDMKEPEKGKNEAAQPEAVWPEQSEAVKADVAAARTAYDKLDEEEKAGLDAGVQ